MSDAPFPKAISFQDPGPEPQHYHPELDRIIDGDPAQSATNLFSSADGRFNCGIWDCQPGKWRVEFSESEFVHLLQGCIIVAGDDGSERTFQAGDAFVCPAGFTGTWHVTEPTKKYYAYYE